jgi:pimeloyl-ACP methyl ester carboxylesterase
MVIVLGVLGVLALLYLGLLFVVLKLTLYPYRMPIFFSPGIMGLKQEEIEVAAHDGVKMSGWWFEPQLEGNRVAILLHGYAMNRSELAPIAVPLARQGFSSVAMDFPGHGRSGPRKTGIGYVERRDVLTLIEFVRQRNPQAQIVLIGSSMGGAAAAFASPDLPASVKGVVLDCVFGRMSEAVPGFMEFIAGKAARMILTPLPILGALFLGFNPFRTAVPDFLHRSRVPMLLLNGERDVIATPAIAKKNLAALADRGEIVWFANCNHAEGRWIHPELYHEALFRFLDRVTTPQPTKENC